MLKQLSIGVFCAIILSACGGSSSNNTPLAPEYSFDNLKESAREELQANGSAAVSIAIYKDGNLVYAEAFGANKLISTTAVNEDTLFQIGSTTKVFTSLATMQLVDAGMFTLDDTITMAVPEIEYNTEQANEFSDIKMHHLLTHQGGFIDGYPGAEGDETLFRYMTKKYGNNAPLMVDAGRFHNYSNPNFSFLGVAIEYYSQQSYHDYMQEFVFGPLGMSHTTMQQQQVLAHGNYALGVYTGDDGNIEGFDKIGDIEQLAPINPAGFNTWSTPTEVLKMADFLLNGNDEIVSENARKEITKKQIYTEELGLPINYGYGIYVSDGFYNEDDWYAEPLWQHSGNRRGYTSMFWILPEKNVAVSILSSGTEDDYTNTMIEAIESVTDLPSPTAIPSSDFDTTTFDRHVGTYQSGDFMLEVTNNNGELMLNSPQFDELGLEYSRELVPIAKNTFLGVQQSEVFEVTFFPADNGSDESVYMRSRFFVGIRLGY